MVAISFSYISSKLSYILSGKKKLMSNTETIAQDIHCHHLWYYEKECAVNSFFLIYLNL